MGAAYPDTPPADQQQRRARAYQYIFAVALAAVGGLMGIAGAFVEESQSLNFLLVLVIGAPVIEEALKPTGVYIALIRWPQALRSQVFTALLAALGGLVFGIIESIVYVTVYVDDPEDWFVLYRFSVTLGLHAVASYIVGLGINYAVIDWAQGRAPLPRASRNFYIAGVALHAVYNTVALGLGIAGVFD